VSGGVEDVDGQDAGEEKGTEGVHFEKRWMKRSDDIQQGFQTRRFEAERQRV